MPKPHPDDSKYRNVALVLGIIGLFLVYFLIQSNAPASNTVGSAIKATTTKAVATPTTLAKVLSNTPTQISNSNCGSPDCMAESNSVSFKEDQLIANPTPIPHKTVPDKLLIKFKDETPLDSKQAAEVYLAQNYGSLLEKGGISRKIAAKPVLSKTPDKGGNRVARIFEIRVPQGELENLLLEFQKDPSIEYAEPVYEVYANSIPNDPYFQKQWALNNEGQTGGANDADINAPQAWDIEQGDPSTIIAIVDTGVDWNHLDLAGNIWTNKREIDGNGLDDDGNGIFDDYHGANFVDEPINFYGEPLTYSDYTDARIWKSEDEVWHFRFGKGMAYSLDDVKYIGNITSSGTITLQNAINLSGTDYSYGANAIIFEKYIFASSNQIEVGFDFTTDGAFTTFTMKLSPQYTSSIYPALYVIGANHSYGRSPLTYPILANAMDDHGHGTHTAGIAAAKMGNWQHIPEGTMVKSNQTNAIKPAGIFSFGPNSGYLADNSGPSIREIYSTKTIPVKSSSIFGLAYDGNSIWYSDTFEGIIYHPLKNKLRFNITRFYDQIFGEALIKEIVIIDDRGVNIANLAKIIGSDSWLEDLIDGEISTGTWVESDFDLEFPWSFNITEIRFTFGWAYPIEFNIKSWDGTDWQTAITVYNNSNQTPTYVLNPPYVLPSLYFSSPASSPTGLAWKNGILQIADSGANRVYSVSPIDGRIISELDLGAISPLGITYAGEDLLVVDQATNTIKRINPSDGSVISSFNSPGPNAAGIGWDGALMQISDIMDKKIYWLSPEGDFGGTAGVCPNCKIMPVKFLSSGGGGSTAGGIRSILYAADNGAKVISNSWGGGGYSQALQDAISYATGKGALVIASAGNSNSQTISYPAGYEGVLSVASTTNADTRASYSNFGSWVDISAPGGEVAYTCGSTCSSTCCRFGEDFAILSTIAKNSLWSCYGGNCGHTLMDSAYLGLSGTSMSAPHVSGAAGLVFSKHPNWLPGKVGGQLIYSSKSIDAQNPGYLGKLGYGRLDLEHALTITPKPKIIYKKMAIKDAESTNPNGYLEPGEEVELEIYLSSDWGNAESTTAILSASSNIDIFSASSPYGKIESGKNVVNQIPFRIRLQSSAKYYDNVQFILFLNGMGEDGSPYSASVTFNYTVIPAYQKGWPKVFSNPFRSTPVVADIDPNFPGLEIAITTYDKLEIWHHDGTPLQGWPKEVGVSTPSIGDLDGDGVNEIIAADHSRDALSSDWGISSIYPKVRAWKYDGTELSWSPLALPRLVSWAGTLMLSPPVISDINADGRDDIVLGSYAIAVSSPWSPAAPYGGVYALDGNGSILPGFPYYQINFTIPESCPFLALYDDCHIFTLPAVGDIDGDGLKEIAVASKDGKIILVASNGSKIAQFSTVGNIIWSSPALADLDKSFYGLEILIGSIDSKVYAFHRDGTTFGAWPKNIGYWARSPFAISDIDGNGWLEIATSAGTKPLLLHSNGTLYGQNLLAYQGSMAAAAPILSDVDADGNQEMIIGRNFAGPGSFYLGKESYLYSIKPNGLQSQFSPLSTWGDSQQSPVATDLDLDGDIEIILEYWGNSGQIQPPGMTAFSPNSGIQVWDLYYMPIQSRPNWPQFQHDAAHTGAAENVMCGDADGNGLISISDIVYLINYIFASGPKPFPQSNGDVDKSGIVTISDAVYLINYIFAGGPAPCQAPAGQKAQNYDDWSRAQVEAYIVQKQSEAAANPGQPST